MRPQSSYSRSQFGLFKKHHGFYGSDTATTRISKTTMLLPQSNGMGHRSPAFSKSFLTGGINQVPQKRSIDSLFRVNSIEREISESKDGYSPISIRLYSESKGYNG